MMYNNIIDEFVDKVLNTDKSFITRDGREKYSFIQVQNGKGKLILGNWSWLEYKYGSVMEKGYKVKAIVSDGLVYVVSPYGFLGLRDEPYPEKVRSFEKEMKKEIKYLNEEILPIMLDELNTEGVSLSEYDLESTARCEIFSGHDRKGINFDVEIIDKDEYTAYLCGQVSEGELVRDFIQKDPDRWVKTKAIVDAVNKIIESGKCVEDWEMEIFDAIRSVDAKKLNVTFGYKGKESTTKIDTQRLVWNLRERGSISGYEISDEKKFMSELGIKSLWKERIDCSHITKITYGRKVLYKKA